MTNGCPECEELAKKYFTRYGYEPPDILCYPCQLADAEADMLRAMNRVEEIKQKIKEQEDELNSQTRAGN